MLHPEEMLSSKQLEVFRKSPKLTGLTGLFPPQAYLSSKHCLLTQLPRRGSDLINCLEESLQPAELPAQCAACSISPSLLSCHSCWELFGDAAAFEFLPVSNLNKTYWFTMLDLSGILTLESKV